jgi:hypothetical protein
MARPGGLNTGLKTPSAPTGKQKPDILPDGFSVGKVRGEAHAQPRNGQKTGVQRTPLKNQHQRNQVKLTM